VVIPGILTGTGGGLFIPVNHQVIIQSCSGLLFLLRGYSELRCSGGREVLWYSPLLRILREHGCGAPPTPLVRLETPLTLRATARMAGCVVYRRA